MHLNFAHERTSEGLRRAPHCVALWHVRTLLRAESPLPEAIKLGIDGDCGVDRFDNGDAEVIGLIWVTSSTNGATAPVRNRDGCAHTLRSSRAWRFT